MIKKKINVNVRMDEDVKEQAEQLFSQLGLNMTMAINLYLRQVVKTRGIPFHITTKNNDIYNDNGFD